MIKHLPLRKGRLLRSATGICLLMCMQAAAQNTHFNIESGTFVNVSGNLVFANTDVLANGNLDAGNGSLFFSGSNATVLAGITLPVIKTLFIHKGTGKLTLNRDITVSNVVKFTNGLLELNGKTLTLSEGAQLQNETETSRITGTSGGRVLTNVSGVNNPSNLNAGNLGAQISSSQNLGNVSITRAHQFIQNAEYADRQSIQRTYLIEPQNNNGLNATLRFYYFDAELNGNNENQLTLWRSSDGVDWLQTNYTSRDAVNNYVEHTALNSLAYYTLADNNNVLPVSLISFRATCQNKFALIEWVTGMEVNAGYFEVQRSSDAINWQTLQKVNATGAANGAAYNYHDLTPQATAFYRLKITDKSGSFSYSAVFSGGCADIAMPFAIYPNPATTHATARISVRQAAKGTVLVYSQHGQLLFNTVWNLQPGLNQLVLPVATLSAGSYVVKVLVNGTTQQTQLIKQ